MQKHCAQLILNNLFFSRRSTVYTNFDLDVSLLIPNVTLFFECSMKVFQKLRLKKMVLEKRCTPLLPAWPTEAY